MRDNLIGGPTFRFAQFEHLLCRLERDEIGRAVELLIERLDAQDGDPDLEETDAEDSFALSGHAQRTAEGPGCIVSDVGGGNITDEPHDWDELHEDDGPEARERHRDRIRRTRCRQSVYAGWMGRKQVEYSLVDRHGRFGQASDMLS